MPAVASPGRAARAFAVIALLPPLFVAAVLWVLPAEGLAGDRTAFAARDYTALWIAGRLAAAGATEILSDPARFTAALRASFGAGFPAQIWPYPPPVLLLAAPLSALPLLAGFVLYTAATFAMTGAALRTGGLRAAACGVVLLSPAMADNALTGQNGALTGALLLGGLLLVDRRPVVAGLLFGGLAIKPQLGFLVPVCLIASGRWRVLVAAAISAGTLVAASAVLFGPATWADFLTRTRPQISAYLETPWQALPSQRIFASAFMAARSLGADLPMAYGAQAAVTLACALVAWRAWRASTPDPLPRLALTASLAMAAAPWVHAYDMAPLAVACVVLLPRVRPAYRPVLAFAWFWPGAVVVLPIPVTLSFASVISIAWLAWSEASRQRAPASPARPDARATRP